MALKIGKLEIGLRLLVSFTSLAVAYAYLGSYLSTLLSSLNYPIAGLLLALAIAGIFAIPQSLGGLLAAIASVLVVYWQSNLIYSLITVGTCLILYWLGFADIRYNPFPDKKLSIIEILSTLTTILLAIILSISIFQIPVNLLASLGIGFLAAAITLIGKQIKDLELSYKENIIILSILSSGSLAFGYLIRIIFYSPKPINFL